MENLFFVDFFFTCALCPKKRTLVVGKFFIVKPLSILTSDKHKKSNYYETHIGSQKSDKQQQRSTLSTK